MIATLRLSSTTTPLSRRIITAVIAVGAVGRSVRGEMFLKFVPAAHLLACAFLTLGAIAIWMTWSVSLRRAAAGVVLCEFAAVAFGALDMQLILDQRTAVNGWFARFYAEHPALIGRPVPAAARPVPAAARGLSIAVAER